jgi:hypothetical protein
MAQIHSGMRTKICFSHPVLKLPHFRLSQQLKKICYYTEKVNGSVCHLFITGYLFGLFFNPEDGSSIWSSKTSVNFHQTTRHHIPEDSTLQMYELLKFITLAPSVVL